MKIYCPECEAENVEDAPLCGLCGHLLNATAPITVELQAAKPKRRFRLPRPRASTAIKVAVGVVFAAFFGWSAVRSGLFKG